MGLTKQYLRYVSSGTFNIIASANCNPCFVSLEGQEGRFVAVGACEHIIIWDLRLGEKAQILSGDKIPIACLASNTNISNIASGYVDGSIRIFDLKSTEVVAIFSGHQSEITCLCYDEFGHKLASGSKDTDIIIWDTIAESGICRLSGHKGPVTQVYFVNKQQTLVSSSKDTFIKFWNLETNHCFKTLGTDHSEVKSICVVKDNNYLISATGDSELSVWRLKNKTDINYDNNSLDVKLEPEIDSESSLVCTKMGSLLRSGKGQVLSMCADVTGQFLACHGTDNLIEVFHFLSIEETKLRHKKRIKNKRNDKELQADPNAMELCVNLRDEIVRLPAIKLANRPKSLDILLGNGGELRICSVLANNTIELFSFNTDVKNSVPRSLRTISIHGHQGEVRALAFSSDNLAIISGSSDSIKMWNRTSQISIRTINTGYVLCAVFIPGDRHVLAGTKDGRVLIIDVGAGDLLEEIPGHTRELWSLCLQTDLRGVVTGGSDCTVKFWNFELIADVNKLSKTKIFSLVHTRTLKLEEGILCVRLSANKKFLAVALLDCTVKIFFVDTFKFYLSLYGHKLPVLCMDISSDSNLLATGSADRNVKIWGMDFGSCHRSIYAHDGSITGLQFVPNTHYFFTCGKDGKVKEWDGDSFNKIATLQGHVGESWNLAVSPNGQFIVTCGSDKVIRLHEKTNETLVLQDEEEEERDQEDVSSSKHSVIPSQPSKSLPSKKTIGSEKATENILECLEVSKKYESELADHLSQAMISQKLIKPLPPLMRAFDVTTVEDFILETLKRIRSSDLEEALLLLPFKFVCELIQHLPALFSRGNECELIIKVAIFLLKIHNDPIIANLSLRPTLRTIHCFASKKGQELRDTIGYNYHGMNLLKGHIDCKKGVQIFHDSIINAKRLEKKRKQKENLGKLIMVVSS